MPRSPALPAPARIIALAKVVLANKFSIPQSPRFARGLIKDEKKISMSSVSIAGAPGFNELESASDVQSASHSMWLNVD